MARTEIEIREEIEHLQAVLASGAAVSNQAGQQTTFRSVAELRSQIAALQRQLPADPTATTTRTRRAAANVYLGGGP